MVNNNIIFNVIIHIKNCPLDTKNMGSNWYRCWATYKDMYLTLYYYLTCTDLFSKWVSAYTVPDKEATTVAKHI